MLAPAKVNLALYLGGVRAADGRHELVTLFQSLTLADELEFSVADADEVICPGVEGPNLAAEALAGLRAAGWDGPPVRVRIDKRIPVAAGMAGGSADAAAVLRRFGAGIEPAVLLDIARGLGADVPAQLAPGLSLGTGAGERVQHFSRALPEHAYVIVPARFGLSTAAVYREADRLGLARSGAELRMYERDLCEAVADGVLRPRLIVNDLGVAALSLAPAIQDALDALGETGAEQAIVSGSGPTAVGIWWGEDAPRWVEAAAAALSKRFPGTTPALPFAGASQSQAS